MRKSVNGCGGDGSSSLDALGLQDNGRVNMEVLWRRRDDASIDHIPGIDSI